jgi:hypothetical protein
MKNAAGEIVSECIPANDFSILVISSPELSAGEYTFWQGETQLAASADPSGGGMRPDGVMGGMPFPGQPSEMEIPEDMEPPRNGRGDDFPKRDGSMTIPEGPAMDPQMQWTVGDRGSWQGSGEESSVFAIVDGANYFSRVAAAK